MDEDDHVFEANLVRPADDDAATKNQPEGRSVTDPTPMNPYAPGPAAFGKQPVTAQPHDFREKIYRSTGLSWLLVFATLFGSVMLFVVASGIATLVAVMIVNGGEFPKTFDNEVVASVMEDRRGFFLSVVLPQLSLIVLPILACFLLPAGPRKSLRLVKGRWPVWGWIAAAAATPLIGTLSSMAIGPFVEESESLKMMSEAFRHHAQTGFLIPVALMIGITPSICEEILFRGFLQPRLTRLMPPIVGVFIASAAFAAMHLDPIHVLGVLPLGLWLGFLSYKSASLFPAMLGHFVNNTLSVMMVVPEDTGALDAPDLVLGIAIFAAGIVGLVGVVVANYRAKTQALATEL